MIFTFENRVLEKLFSDFVFCQFRNVYIHTSESFRVYTHVYIYIYIYKHCDEVLFILRVRIFSSFKKYFKKHVLKLMKNIGVLLLFLKSAAFFANLQKCTVKRDVLKLVKNIRVLLLFLKSAAFFANLRKCTVKRDVLKLVKNIGVLLQLDI